MQVNLFNRPLQSLDVQKQNDEAHNISLEKNLKTLDKAQAELSKIDKKIASLNKQSASVETLAMLAAQQKQVVLAMLGGNPEMAIAALLAQGIENYAEQLEQLQGWTNGGADMFESALYLMLQDLQDGGVNPNELEDLFQIALLEIMVDPEKYGLGQWYQNHKTQIAHLLESIGSASHGFHEDDYDTASELADLAGTLYDEIQNANIPAGSFLDEVMTILENAGGSDALSTQIETNYHDDYGWWVNDPPGNPASELSPMLRLFMLSALLEDNPQMTQEEVELILTAPLSDIDSYISSTFGADVGGTPYTALTWLCDNSRWQLQTGQADKGGHGGQIDWIGDGINTNDLVLLYANFPSRELTKEELKEVNRIGDQVQMLQETLKYWLSIMRDEQLAAGRNI
ncbi:hypothetical protein LL266_15505 [Vibrio anguillarum]|uniref:hypothetical protein n=1 Tax=Vibrio TaxID=662 RepID=UPI00030799D8|nr:MULTISPECIES: hypothetical protein [Vibrio]MCC4237901.1 hypothetical protein [Vibrio anguillarum]MDT3848429.1 hypothetical protein [Vibrio anguillarum]NOI03987.1 hypothetical protein [Vibrio anguillarum]OEE78015.1 hypothetical protein A1QQ_12690 [Vibrio ordalii FF-167]